MNAVQAKQKNPTASPSGKQQDRKKKIRKLLSRIYNARDLYLIILIPFIYVLIFNYGPMYGAQIAFRKYNPMLGISESPWIGLDNFTRFFSVYNFGRIIINTLTLSIYGLIAGVPIAILLALGLNSTRNQGFKKTIQMVTYAPYFLSVVVLVGMLTQLLSPQFGIVNRVLALFGVEAIDFMGSAAIFPHLYVWSGVWQGAGYSSIIYLATLSSVDPELHEAAKIDGASMWKRIWYIDIPTILPTIIVLLILDMGKVLSVGFDKAYLMQKPLNLTTSEIISTYVYKVGLTGTADLSYASAVGLFQSLVGLVMVAAVNQISKKVSETSLW